MTTTTHFDCIVVGAGVEGSATAYELVKNGKKTLMLEKFPLPHTRGSSHGASRITRRVYIQNEIYTEMMTEAYPLWERLEKDTGKQLFRKTGVLWMARQSEGNIPVLAKVMRQNKLVYKLLSAQDVNQQYPQLNYNSEWSGLFDPDGGILYADRCVNAFRTEFQRLGGVLRDAEAMSSLIPGKPVQIQTNKGSYTCDSVVLCLGAWAPNFLKSIGLNLPLQPMTVKACYWDETVPGQYSADNGFPCLITDDSIEGHFYGLPADEYPNKFKFCWYSGTNIEDPDFRDAIPPAVAKEIAMKPSDYIQKYLRNLKTEPSIIETCIFTMTPDMNFVLDRHPQYNNVIIGAGFSGHGFKLAPVVGKILAALATNKAPKYNLTCFKATRFPTTSSKL